MIRGKEQFELVGIDEVVKEFKKLGEETVLKTLDESSKQISTELLSETQRRAPVRTGFLRSDLEILQRSVGKKGMIVRVGARRARHAMLQEYGTRFHAARPFIRPAIDALRARAVDIIKSAIKEAVEK